MVSQRLKNKERLHERCMINYENYRKIWRDHDQYVEKHFTEKSKQENYTGEFKNEKVIKTEIETELSKLFQ